jgi:hypothetical protein
MYYAVHVLHAYLYYVSSNYINDIDVANNFNKIYFLIVMVLINIIDKEIESYYHGLYVVNNNLCNILLHMRYTIMDIMVIIYIYYKL